MQSSRWSVVLPLAAGVFAAAHLSSPTRAPLQAAIAPLAADSPAAVLPRHITQYRIDRWMDTDGLPQNSIHAIAQTADRFLWLASEEGLIRFDGSRFVIFNPGNTPSLARSQMLALAASPDGTLWIGTAGGGLVAHAHGGFSSRTSLDGLPSDRVQTVAVGADGAVWAGTDRGLARLAPDGELRVYTREHGLPHDEVLALAVEEGAAYVGTRAGMVRVEGDDVRFFEPGPELPAGGVRALAHARAGGIWIGVDDGSVVHYDGEAFTQLDARIGGAPVLALAEDERGAVWVGTNGRGLHRWIAGRLETLDNANGGADLVWALHTDPHGGLWLGSNGRGLFHLRRTAFVPTGTPEGLSGDIALAVLETSNGDRWVGTAGAGLNRIDAHGRITHYGERQGLAARMVLSLAELPDGDVLIGSHAGSLTRFRAGRFTPIGERYGLQSAIMAILPAADGSFWLGTTGGVYHVDGGRVLHIDAQSGLADNFVMTLHASADGAIWAGTRRGASRIEGGRVTPHAGSSALEGVAVAAFFDAGHGRLWAATQGRGIAQIAADGARFLDSGRGLCEDLIHAIVDDGQGSVWLSSNRGVLRIARGDLDAAFAATDARVACHVYDRADGLRSREANGGFAPAAALLADGSIMFPTMQGIVIVDPARIEPAPAAASVVLQTAVLAGDTLALAALPRVVLDGGGRDLEVHFTSPSYHAPDRLRFRFRLVGFDQSWRDAGARRAAYYTNLPPGDYTFRVAVANEDGVWHETATTLAVSVPHRFYERVWFILLCALLAVGAIVWIHRRRMAAADRRAAELAALVEERTRAEERYRDLFENASDMIFTTDRQGRILSWNGQAEQLTGWNKADAIGTPVERVLPGVGPMANVRRREIHFKRRDGAAAAVEIAARAMTERGETVGSHVVGRDVLEWRRIQSQLEQAAKMEAIGQLAGGVAHDFNNLLTVITSYGAILDSDLPESSPLRHEVEQIRVAADTAAGLTRQLLAFSRRQVLQPRVVDVNEETVKVVSMLRRIIGVDISVRTDLADTIWPVHADAGQLEQVLMNLAVNARDAMPHGGELRFRTRNLRIDAAAADRLGLNAGRYVDLTIEDTGVGIEPAVLPHLFEPFFTTKEPGRGTGLGLATVYGVVRQSGGDILVESEPAKGTRFRILLPAAAAENGEVAGMAAPDPDVAALHPKAGILLVEDEAAVNRLARRILERNGYVVVPASSGAEALQALARHGAVELLLTDVVMPGMTGRELAARVLAMHPGTRVLYMSGYTEDEVIRGGALPDGERFIGKPFTPNALLAAVAAALTAGPAAPVSA